MIPHLFRPHPIPDTIPKKLEKQIAKFSETSKSDEEFIKKCFFFVVSLQKGHRTNVLLQFHRLFHKNLELLCGSQQYFHCTTANYLLRVMLEKSGRLPSECVTQKASSTWTLFPHQYLRVKIKNNEYINLDPWAYRFGIDFGDYSHGFHTGKIFPIR